MVLGIIIAALSGLAVGLERQWSGHASGPRARFGGARTFTLLGLLSGTAGWLWTIEMHALSVVLIAGASGVILTSYISAARRDRDATTEVAGLVVLAGGVAGGIGFWSLTAAISAVTTLLLVEKSRIHDLARSLDGTAVRAGVRFGVMAVVILPILPEGPFGPWGGLRPRTLWIAVLIFSGLSFGAYITRRALRGSLGYPVAGLLGGVISSTGTAFAFSRLSRSSPKQATALALGVVGASTVLFLRVLVATSAMSPPLAKAALPYFVLPFTAGAVATVLGIRRLRKTVDEPAEIKNPLQFWTSLQMAAVFQGVLYLAHGLGNAMSNKGLLIWGAVLGLTDVDALTLAMARGDYGVAPEASAMALSVGILSNTAFKVSIVLALGRGRFRWFAFAGLLALGLVLGAALLLF